MMREMVGGKTWVYKPAPAIKATYHQHTNKLVINVDPEPYPDNDAPPAVPVDTIDNIDEDSIKDHLTDIDILRLLADKYTETIYRIAEEAGDA